MVQRAMAVRHAPPVPPLLRLQRAVGNHGVGQVLQAKLTVNRPGDVYEQEADHVADAVMQMPGARLGMDTSAGIGAGSSPTPTVQPMRIQRLCAGCEDEMQRQAKPDEDEEKLQRQAMDEEEVEAVRAKESPGATPTVTPHVQAGVDAMRGSGQPLPPSARAFFEPRFGYDLGHVRLHADARAADTARAVNARAFTVGRDIAFGAGEFAPGTEAGRRLLAHELAHVGQQNSIQKIARSPAAAEPETGPDAGQPARTSGGPKPVWRISALASQGWAKVDPTYTFFKSGEPFELPHFLEVEEDSRSASKVNVVALEGRYRGKDANIDPSGLMPAAPPSSAASAVFDMKKGEFWYGGAGPIKAKTDPTNPVPAGKHDIEIPDYHHTYGASYGDFGTTWFRLGHSGDRYLHPGRVSLGCATILDTKVWPDIWKYLIAARSNNETVGELTVI